MEALKYATQIVQRLNTAGYTAYFAGGWVRDYVMDHPSSDVDIATNAPPEVILDLFPRTILVGLAFGVVVVIFEGHQFEISTFRRDLNYEGGRRPESVEFADAREDALRRDFTINGMFYDPIEKKIIDLVGGCEDIDRKLIRTIGNPQERFVEDRLRMIRAVRFATRFGFRIDQDTQIAIEENADTLFPAVAMERIWQEFTKMADYPHLDHAMIELHRFRLLQTIFPSLADVHLNEIKKRVSHYAHFPEGTPPLLYILELFPSSTLEEQLDICKLLKLSNQQMRLTEYMAHLYMLKDSENLVEWAHAYAHPHANVGLNVMAARLPDEERSGFLLEHQIRRESLNGHVQRIVKKQPLVSSYHLKDLGVAPGPGMGALLKEAERIAIDKDLDDPQAVLNLLQKQPLWRQTC